MSPALRSHMENGFFFIALMSAAIALGGALAHAFEFFVKMGLSREDYFTVQQIYAGWNRLAVILVSELIGMVGVLLFNWRRPHVFTPAAIALLGLLAAQAIFWTWTFPANVATENWTSQPEDWETLRRNWEYSHFAGAICQLIAMASMIIAVLARRRPDDGYTG